MNLVMDQNVHDFLVVLVNSLTALGLAWIHSNRITRTELAANSNGYSKVDGSGSSRG